MLSLEAYFTSFLWSTSSFSRVFVTSRPLLSTSVDLHYKVCTTNVCVKIALGGLFTFLLGSSPSFPTVSVFSMQTFSAALVMSWKMSILTFQSCFSCSLLLSMLAYLIKLSLIQISTFLLSVTSFSTMTLSALRDFLIFVGRIWRSDWWEKSLSKVSLFVPSSFP